MIHEDMQQEIVSFPGEWQGGVLQSQLEVEV
jgi:hypothetical protein